MPNPRTRPLGCVPPPYGTRLCDLLSGNVGLIAWCGTCGRSRPLDVPALARRHGDLMQLKTLETKLRCTDDLCRTKGGYFFVDEQAVHRIAPYR